MITAETTPTEMQQHLDHAEEQGGILSIINDIKEQVDIALDVKESLEAKLDATLKKLSEESAVRAQLEQKVNVLEAQIDQLQKDMLSVKEQWDKFANFVSERSQELETVNQ